MKSEVIFKKDIAAIILVSLYLLVFSVLTEVESLADYAMLMWIISPIFVIGMVLVVLKYGVYAGRELGNSEYGYADKSIVD